jgi:hypothetical protein
VKRGATTRKPSSAPRVRYLALLCFVLHGNICALPAAKDRASIFIYDPAAADPHGIINQGDGNATARAVQIYHDDQINGPALLTMFRAVIANNRAGGGASRHHYPRLSPRTGRPDRSQLNTGTAATRTSQPGAALANPQQI